MGKYFLFLLFTALFFNSCKTKESVVLYNPTEVNGLSTKLAIPISNLDKADDANMPLYAEASLWLGVPYIYGGMSRKGLDCSGFTNIIYKKVYGLTIPRSTAELSTMRNIEKINQNKLRPGDLVFFATSKSKKKITHVGIYLKSDNFIHASTSKGVTVSTLKDRFYNKAFVRGGRLKL